MGTRSTMNGLYRIIGYLMICCAFSSCAFLLGIHDPQPLSRDKIDKFHKKFTITEYYEINPDAFLAVYARQRADTHESVMDQLCQPLQLIVFDREAHLLCHLINCNIGGIPLKWNRYGSFDSVPVLPKEIREPDYTVSYEEIGRYLNPQMTKEEMERYLIEYDYIYFVYYCKCLGSFTKSYLNLIRDYQKENAGRKIKYIYVMTDPLLHQLVEAP